jgi:hypothetical protein
MTFRLLPPNHLIPTEKLLLFLFSRWDVVCLYIHWVVQNTKQRFFSSVWRALTSPRDWAKLKGCIITLEW